MAEPSPPSDGGGLSCVFRDCDNNASTCVYTCVFSSPFLSPPHFPPPPPPSTAAKSSQSHFATILISMVCILGISFLLLTTCTIILRYRFSNRRRNSTARIDESPIDDDDGDSVVDHPIWYIATVGLQQSVIDSITAFKYKKVDGLLIDGSDCSVCLTGFEDGDDFRLLPKCNHAFHISCIDTWLRSHKNCPLCRAPVVNDNYGAESVDQLSSGNLDGGQVGEIENLENNNGGSLPLEEGTGESSHQLPIEIKNREFRILSDLSENYRFRGKDEDGVEPIRRSISFNSVAASTIHRAMSNVCTVGNEGSSTNTDPVVQEKKINIEKVSGLLMKSSSNIGDSLQKGPVSMKRSLSSSSKLFSFRKTKNQASILPL